MRILCAVSDLLIVCCLVGFSVAVFYFVAMVSDILASSFVVIHFSATVSLAINVLSLYYHSL